MLTSPINQYMKFVKKTEFMKKKNEMKKKSNNKKKEKKTMEEMLKKCKKEKEYLQVKLDSIINKISKLL